MNKIIYLFLVIISFPLLSQGAKERITEDIKYLSSELLEGRFAGTKGFELAATLIENRFKSLGLKPIGNSYFQEFDVALKSTLDTNNSILDFQVIIPKPGIPIDKIKPRSNKLTCNTDWKHISFSADGSFDAELAFVGYGIDHKETKYNDYETVDIKGKVAIIFAGVPYLVNDKSPFGGDGSFSNKAKLAQEKGAVAVIFVNEQGDSADKFLDFGTYTLPEIKIPVIQVRRSSISKYFPKGSELVNLEEEIAKNKKPKSFLLQNIRLNSKVQINRNKVATKNVVAYLEVNPQSKDYFIISAHFDHLGRGRVGSRAKVKGDTAIHNGADDNASGTAGMLELAKRYSEKKPKNNILFIGFAAEEMGLLGSIHYAKNPLIGDSSNIKFMYNLDMIGMLSGDTLHPWGTGTSAEFNSIIDELNQKYNFIIKKTETGEGPSDHAIFYRKGVPVIHIFTGLHPYYHTPDRKSVV